jgi:hypothetical protein
MDDEIKTQGKHWQKPELTVLVRSRPEEAILQTCRTPGTPTGYGHNRAECYYPNSGCPGSCSGESRS